MIKFFLTFLLLYGGMHYYVFRRLCSVTRLGWGTGILFLMLTTAPLLVRLAEHFGKDRIAFFIAWPGFVWMGMLFFFCTALFMFDMVRAINWYAFRRSHTKTGAFFSAAATCKAALSIAIMATLYSLYEVRHISVERIVLHSRKTPHHVKPLRIVQISDVHLGLLMNESRLEGILKEIVAAQPDILVSTGDLVDGRLSLESLQKLEKQAKMIRTVSAPMGKYAIAGNHEYYAGIDEAITLTKSAGFKFLRNETITLPSGITISGADDPASVRMGLNGKGSESDTVKALPTSPFHILLKHRPLLQQESDGTIDLQLSGHTHKGQLLPFYPLTWLEFPIHSGTTKTDKGTTVHVSRGTGTWGPPMRFFAPPEITIISIVPGN